MEQFRTWEEMTALEQAAATYWDFHKDVYGFRPHHAAIHTWTLEDFDREFALLEKAAVAERAAEAEREAQAVKKVEKTIAKLIASGAGDRATAVRWLHDAEDTNGDEEYLCYKLGVPYGYFKQATA